MQMDLRIRNTDLADVLRRYSDRRLRFAMSGFGDRVGRMVITISRVNGPDPIKGCRIEAELKPFGQMVVEATDLDMYTAIDRATGRLGRLLALRLEHPADGAQRLTTNSRTSKARRRQNRTPSDWSQRLPRRRLPRWKTG